MDWVINPAYAKNGYS